MTAYTVNYRKYLQHKSCDHFKHLRQSSQVTAVPHPLTITHVVGIQYLPKSPNSRQDGRASDPRGSKNISSRVSRSLLQSKSKRTTGNGRGVHITEEPLRRGSTLCTHSSPKLCLHVFSRSGQQDL